MHVHSIPPLLSGTWQSVTLGGRIPQDLRLAMEPRPSAWNQLHFNLICIKREEKLETDQSGKSDENYRAQVHSRRQRERVQGKPVCARARVHIGHSQGNCEHCVLQATRPASFWAIPLAPPSILPQECWDYRCMPPHPVPPTPPFFKNMASSLHGYCF